MYLSKCFNKMPNISSKSQYAKFKHEGLIIFLFHVKIRFLKMSLEFDKIRKQDADYIIVYVGRNPIGGELAWEFFNTQWAVIKEEYVYSFKHK